MGHNSAAKNAFGTLGVICWTVQLLPQIWKTYRTKSSKGLSPVLVLFWGLSGIPLGIYNIIQNTNIPLILQPQLFGFLCLFSWIQCQYYGNGRSVVWCACVYIAMLVVFAALEVGIVYAVRPHYERGEISGEIGVRFLSVLASVMIAVALLPQYYEIYKHKAVIGISMTFIIVDLLGGVFSDISLAFEAEFDPWLAVSYSIVSVMDSVIIVAALILNPRARRLEQRRAQHDAESRVVDQDTLDSRATPTVSQVGDTSATVTSTGEDERRDPEKADE